MTVPFSFRLQFALRRLVVTSALASALLLPSAQSTVRQQGAASATSTAAPLAAQPSGSISGRILRADTGMPLAGAIVKIEMIGISPSDSQVMRTGADGAYRFTDVDPGTYTVMATHAGFGPGNYRPEDIQASGLQATWIHIDAGQLAEGKDVRMPLCTPNACPQTVTVPFPQQEGQRPWLISGTLRYEDGDPVNDGFVYAAILRYTPDGQSQSILRGQTVVDEQGNFQMRGLPVPNENTISIYLAATAISARGAGYATVYYPNVPTSETAQKFTLSAGTQIRDLHMVIKTTPMYAIRGRLMMKDPSGGNQHYLVALGGSSANVLGMQPLREAVVVRPDGSFTIRGLQAGKYVVDVRQANREPSGDFVLYQPVVGFPVASEEVEVTNADAQVEIPVGGTGTSIGVSPGGPGAFRGPAAMRGPASIRGTVVLEGQEGPLPTGPMIVLGLGRQQAMFGGVPGYSGGSGPLRRDGAFEIPGLLPGRYTLRVQGSYLLNGFPPQSVPVYIKSVVCGGMDYTEKPIVIEVGTALAPCTVTLAKGPGVVGGTVQDGSNPASKAMVILVPQSLGLRQNPSYLLTGQVDSQGRFQITNVIPGDYFAFAVPVDPNNGYFAPRFVEANRANATSVTVQQNGASTANLKLFTPK